MRDMDFEDALGKHIIAHIAFTHTPASQIYASKGDGQLD